MIKTLGTDDDLLYVVQELEAAMQQYGLEVEQSKAERTDMFYKKPGGMTGYGRMGLKVQLTLKCSVESTNIRCNVAMHGIFYRPQRWATNKKWSITDCSGKVGKKEWSNNVLKKYTHAQLAKKIYDWAKGEAIEKTNMVNANTTN